LLERHAGKTRQVLLQVSSDLRVWPKAWRNCKPRNPAGLILIAVPNAKKTGHLVKNDADPHPCDEDQTGDPQQKADGIDPDSVSRLHIPREWHQDEAECHRQEPQDAKKREGEIFMEVSPVYQFQTQERKHEDEADDGWYSEGCREVFHSEASSRYETQQRIEGINEFVPFPIRCSALFSRACPQFTPNPSPGASANSNSDLPGLGESPAKLHAEKTRQVLPAPGQQVCLGSAGNFRPEGVV
jgi:hypothetical protein